MRHSTLTLASFASTGAVSPWRKRTPNGLHSSSTPSKHLCCTRISCNGKVDSNGHSEEEDQSEDLNEKTRKLVEENPKVQKAVQRITDAAIKYAEAIQKRENLQHEFIEVSKQESFFKRKEKQVLAEAEREAAQKQMEAAQLRLSAAKQEQLKLAQIASQYAERVESIKCAIVGCLGGLTVLLPLVLLSSDSIEQKLLDLSAVAVTSVLFAITYRYAIGRGENTQLKIGVIAAFVVVSSLSFGQSLWHASEASASPLDVVLSSEMAVYSAQSSLHYLASTCAIEYSIQTGFVQLQAELEQTSSKSD